MAAATTRTVDTLEGARGSRGEHALSNLSKVNPLATWRGQPFRRNCVHHGWSITAMQEPGAEPTRAAVDARASMGSGRVPVSVACSRWKMGSGSAQLRLPLLFLSVVVVRVPCGCDGELRRVAAFGVGNSVSAAWRIAADRGGERLAGLRLGLPIWICAGPFLKSADPKADGALMDWRGSLCGAWRFGFAATGCSGLERSPIRRAGRFDMPALSRRGARGWFTLFSPGGNAGERVDHELV